VFDRLTEVLQEVIAVTYDRARIRDGVEVRRKIPLTVRGDALRLRRRHRVPVIVPDFYTISYR